MADFTSDIVTKEQLDRLSDAAGGQTGFLNLSGAVTQQSPLALAADVAAIAANDVIIDGTIDTSSTASTSASFSAADANNARIDLVVWTTAGAVAVRAGTAAADPVPGTLQSGDVELAQVKINAGATTVVTADITDRRQRVSLGGWRLVGSNTTEQTMTSATAADLVTISGLNIAALSPIKIVVRFRKSAATHTPTIGLKLNSTVVAEAVYGSAVLGSFAATNEAQDGTSVIYIGARETNYVNGITGSYASTGASGGAGAVLATVLTATLPTVALTSLAIRGDSDGTNTLGVKDVRVYVGAT